MDFINFHIAYLLTKHECVIIPDFGAFVTSKTKENKLNKRGFISPPANFSLTFNPEIIKDDGLLVHSVATEKALSDEEALCLINDYVDGLVDNLREGQTVQFPWIGKIHLSSDRKIVFTPAKNLSCNASNCGLVNLNFPALAETSEKEFLGKSKKFYKRPRFYIILAVIVLLLAVLSVLLFSKQLNNNCFSFSNLSAVGNIFKVNSVKPAVCITPVNNTDSIKPVIDDSLKQNTTDTLNVSLLEYFIIVSSLSNEKEAEVMLNYFLAKGLSKAKIIHLDEKYRISIETFNNKEEAVSFLDMIRKNKENPLFKDAWIFDVSH